MISEINIKYNGKNYPLIVSLLSKRHIHINFKQLRIDKVIRLEELQILVKELPNKLKIAHYEYKKKKRGR